MQITMKYVYNFKKECKPCYGHCYKPEELAGFIWQGDCFDCPFFADSICAGVQGACGVFFSPEDCGHCD